MLGKELSRNNFFFLHFLFFKREIYSAPTDWLFYFNKMIIAVNSVNYSDLPLKSECEWTTSILGRVSAGRKLVQRTSRLNERKKKVNEGKKSK